MKKLILYRVISIVFLVIIISLSVVCYNSYNTAKYAKIQIANNNYIEWGNLLQMTDKIQNNIKSLEDIKDFAFYQNTVLYLVSDSLNPSFNGENSKCFRFLVTRYDPLMQDLAFKRVPEFYLQEGFDLFMSMNKDLKSICEYVVNSKHNQTDVKLEIMKNKSTINKQIQSKINDFCNKYDEKISAYHNKFSLK